MLTEERESDSSENVTAFTLTAGEGNIPDYIIQTIISQWSFKVHFPNQSPEAKKEMNIKCWIFLSLKIANNKISYRIFKKFNKLENVSPKEILFSQLKWLLLIWLSRILYQRQVSSYKQIKIFWSLQN